MAKVAVPALFGKSKETSSMFDELMSFVRTLGKSSIEEKKTCVHVVAGKAAFLGIHPRKDGLRITVVLDHAVDSPRIAKCDKASAKRFHVDLNLSPELGLDKHVRGWIAGSYARAIG